MPIYEYVCGACSHHLDALQKLSDAPLIDCPQCSAPQLKRQMSAPSFRLKGGGWYETDFKNDKRRNISESDSTTADVKPADGKQADGKPADKAPDKPADKSDGKADAKPAKTDKPAATEAKKPEAAPAAKKPDPGKAGSVA
jgi:putative FmdB family regulatory protein